MNTTKYIYFLNVNMDFYLTLYYLLYLCLIHSLYIDAVTAFSEKLKKVISGITPATKICIRHKSMRRLLWRINIHYGSRGVLVGLNAIKRVAMLSRINRCICLLWEGLVNSIVIELRKNIIIENKI